MSNLFKLFFLLLVLISCNRQPVQQVDWNPIPFLNVKTNEIDSLVQTMSVAEKVRQLILYRPDFSAVNTQAVVSEVVKQKGLGGVLLEHLPLKDYIALADSLKIRTKLPLFFATQESIILHNQFSDLPHFPQQISLDAADSLEAKQQLARHFQDQCQALGINLSLSNIIKQSDLASKKQENFGYAFQDNKINRTLIRRIAQSTENRILSFGDSFSDLVYLQKDSSTLLDSLLFPYQMPIGAGLAGFKVGQEILAIDTIQELPTFFVKEYLQNQLKFNGLLLAEHSEENSLEKLFHTGTDLYLTPELDSTFQFLMAFVEQGILSKKDLNLKVKKILQAKAWINNGELLREDIALEKNPLAQARLIKNSLRTPKADPRLVGNNKSKIIDYFKNPAWGFMARMLFEQSIVIVNNPNQAIPFQEIQKEDFRVLHYGKEYFREFENAFKKYAFFSHQLMVLEEEQPVPAFQPSSYQYSRPVIVLDNLDLKKTDSEPFVAAVNLLAALTPTTVVNFGNAENLPFFNEKVATIQVFESNKTTQALVAQLLFGAVEGKGKLPNSLNENLVAGTTNPIQPFRVKYAPPEEVGIAKARLSSIDALMRSAIDGYATPGGQVVVAKEGKIIYSKSFGHHTYQANQRVHKTDLYDVASLTKPAATTLMSMKLWEQKRFNLLDPLKKISPQFNGKSIGWIRLRDLLTHKSGLQPHMPIGKYLSKSDTTHALCTKYFCTSKQDSFSLSVTPNLFFHEKYRQKIHEDVLALKKDRRRRSFRYSDVNFYLIQQVLEEKANQNLDSYVYQNFYAPLGLRHTRFNPMEKFSKYQIVPTQKDTRWRKQLLRGTVHDETAALLGGVAGNAGLFSTGEEIAVLFQMLLNGGHYGGVQYFEEKTVDYFTGSGHGNHRGLGFDKPSSRKTLPYAKSASRESFGHTGYTGACVWADPTEDLVFVFLNNRIHPNTNNRNLTKKRTRSRIHQVIYDALESFNYELPILDFEGENG